MYQLQTKLKEGNRYSVVSAKQYKVHFSYSSITTPQNGPTLTTITRKDVTNTNGLNPTWSHLYADCYYEPDNPDPICPGITNPPPPPPPIPAVCGLPGLACVQSGYTRGRIRVWDTQLNQCVAVHDVQVRVKRWFKISNQHTNVQGEFAIGTRYNNNAKVSVIFRNGELSVKPLRNKVGVRLSLFPVDARLGVFSNCELNKIEHIFFRTSGGLASESQFASSTGDNRFTRTFLHWLGATAIVTRKYQIAQGNVDKVKPMEARSLGGHRLQLYLATGGTPHLRGVHLEIPMLAYINKGITWTDAFDLAKLAIYSAKTYLTIYTGGNIFSAVMSYYAAIQSLLNLVLQGSLPDAIVYYNTPNQNLSSSELCQKFSEVYTIAGLVKNRSNQTDIKAYLNKEGKILSGILSVYTPFENAVKYPATELGEFLQTLQVDNWFKFSVSISSIASSSVSVFQTIETLHEATDKEVLESYQGFSEAYSHFLTDRKYLNLSDDLIDQNFAPLKSSVLGSAHKQYIETWKSKNVPDKLSTRYLSGIFYDCFDGENDFVNGDQNQYEIVSNLTWENISKAGLGSIGSNTSPQSFAEWRQNLVAVNPTQSTSISSLFNWYLTQ